MGLYVNNNELHDVLDKLIQTEIESPLFYDTLLYNGQVWQNLPILDIIQNVIDECSINSLVDVNTTNATNGNSLIFSDGVWVAKELSTGLDESELAEYLSSNNYITASSLSGYATQSWVTSQGYLTESALSGYATQSWVTSQGYLTAHQSLSDYAKLTDIPTSLKSPYALTFGSKSYNGSAAVTLTAADLGALTSISVVNSNPTLSWGSTSTVGTVYGTSLQVTMPSNPNTDTKNTAGTTNLTATKMYLIGATSQAANPQTYSNANCYIGTDNCLYSGGAKVAIASALTNGSVTKIGTATVGSATRPIYLNAGVPTAGTNTFGNASGNAAVSNGTVCTNLNADMVDGVHNGSLTASTLATARSLWGNSFNGSADVGGTIVTSQHNALITQSSLSDGMDWILYHDGKHFYVVNAESRGSNTIGSLRPMALRNDGWVGFAHWAIVAQSAGNVGIGFNTYTPTLSAKLHVNGNILATDEVTSYSDARGKQSIEPLKNRGGIQPVTYIKDGKRSIGFLAQDVQKLYPELVHDDGTDKHWLSLNYMQYTAVLQAQINDIDTDVEQLKADVKSLRADNRRLRKEINRLKQERI